MLRRRLVIALGALGFAAPAGGAPAGRVVRIEHAGEAYQAPRICELRRAAATCVGDQPRSGQVIAVVGDHGVVAEATVTDASNLVDSCHDLWTVKYQLTSGTLPEGGSIGVIDGAVDHQRARVIDRAHLPPSPSGQPGDEVWQGVDRDGDGTPDILFTHYPCDAEGNLVSGGHDFCLDIWARMRRKLVRTTQVNFAQCNL